MDLFRISAFILLLAITILIFPTCSGDVDASDPSDIQKIANAAVNLLSGCPEFFYHPLLLQKIPIFECH